MEQKCSLFSTVILAATLLLGVEATGGGKRTSDYSYSKPSEFENPDEFWPVSSSLHGNSAPSSSITAVLFDAVLTSGEADLDAVEFDGTSGSFMKITNTGDLDGQDAFCWVFNLYPFSDQAATILEYAGSGGSGNGIKLAQEGTSLNVKLYDHSGVLLGEYSRDILTINSWNFVGLSYNKAWGRIDIIQDATLKYLDIGVVDKLVNALGDVIIGNSADGSSPFHGKVSCIQFYQKTPHSSALENPPSFCTLAQWSSSTVLDWTRTFEQTVTIATGNTTTLKTSPYSTATNLTTTCTPTTAAGTTVNPTISSNTASSTTTSTATTTTTNSQTFTTSAMKKTSTITTTSVPEPQILNGVRGTQGTLSDACYHFLLLTTSHDLQPHDVVAEARGRSFTDCAMMCTSHPACLLFVTHDNGDCHLGSTASPILITSSSVSSKVYVMVKVVEKP